MDNRQQGKDAAHQGILERLPWYASGALRGAERAAVAAHLERCEDCREELELELRTAALFRAPAMAPRSPEPGLAKLLERIAAPQAARPTVPAPPAIRRGLGRLASWFGDPGWSRALAGAGAFALALGVSLATWRELAPEAPPATSFHVLGDAPATPADAPNDIHLVLAPTVDDARRQALLDAVGGRIVGGPNSAGAITVRVGASGEALTLGAALERLRREPDVLLAEAAAPMAMPHTGPEGGQ